MKKGLVGIAAIAATLALTPAVAGAATITVSTTVDEAGTGLDCSLREAVNTAVTNLVGNGCDAGGEVVGTLDNATTDDIVLPSGPYALGAAGQIAIGAGGPIIIRSDNPTARRTISMADQVAQNRIFQLMNGADLTLRTLTITSDDDVASANGGIVEGFGVDMRLTLENSELNATKVGVSARQGGLIWFSSGVTGQLTIRDSELTGGEVSNAGGAVWADTAPVLIERSSIHTNTSNSTFNGFGRGGGVQLNSNGAALTMTDSEVYNNDVTTTSAAPGCSVVAGGIDVGEGGTIKRSLIYDNSVTSSGTCGERGGGIAATGTLNVSNTTIAGNKAGTDGIALTGTGGGMSTSNGTTNLNHVTFAGNTAASSGDQLVDSQDTGFTTYTGSIFSGGDDPCSDVGAAPPDLVSGGYNAITPADCPSVGTDSVGGSIGLAALPPADNGGTVVGGTGGTPIRTLAISGFGTAFNLVPTGNCAAAEGTDQRGAGFTRPQAGACDAGAFELVCTPGNCPEPPPGGGSSAGTVLAPIAAAPGLTGQQAAALKKCKKKKGKARKKCKKKALKLPA